MSNKIEQFYDSWIVDSNKKIDRLSEKLLKGEGNPEGIESELELLKSQVEDLKKPSQLNEDQVGVIEKLLEKGYKIKREMYHDKRTPILYRDFQRRVRIRVNNLGIMILLDPGAGMQMLKENFFKTPNAYRLDYGSYSFKNWEKTLEIVEDRAKLSEEEDQTIENLIEEGWI